MTMMRGFAAAVLVSVAHVGSGHAGQAGPGLAWMMVPSQEREIRVTYWRDFQQTEVWTYVVPKAPGSHPARPLPMRLVVSGLVRGRAQTLQELASLPGGSEVSVLAQPDPRAILPRSSSFSWVSRDGHLVDLFRLGQANLGMCLDVDAGCNLSVAARMSTIQLLDLAREGPVEADILGFRCTLDASDTAALRSLVQHLATSRRKNDALSR
jgi:hypothetical protein